MSLAAHVVVDPRRELGRVDPLLYGQFLSRRRWVTEDALFEPDHPDADGSGLRRSVTEAVRELAPPVIRWPGGCTGTSYEWQFGVGDPASRPRTVDWHFGYDVGNGFGTAEFVDFCAAVGAEPQINLTTGTGSLREALAWLEYCNGAADSHWANLRRSHGHPDPFGVRFWQIGNEDWGEWEIGQLPAGDHARRCREWAKAIHKSTPRVAVIAAGAWREDLALDWNVELLRQAWDDLDYLALHTYWSSDQDRPDGGYDQLIGASVLEERAIVALAGLIELVAREKRSEHRPRLAFTEWNCAGRQQAMSPQWRPGRPQYRMVDALAVAGFLNVLQRQAAVVGLANFAQTINVVGALVVDADHVIKETVYWPLWMQRHHSGPVAVDATVWSPTLTCARSDTTSFEAPVVDVSATRSEDGDTVWLSVLNRHPSEPVRVSIDLLGTGGPAATGWLLSAEDPLDGNTIENPDAITPQRIEVGPPGTGLDLPAASFLIASYPITSSPIVSVAEPVQQEV